MTPSRFFMSLPTLGLIAALSLSGCYPGTVFMENEDEEPTIEIKEHPQPGQAYQLTMVIENAPGPFAMVEGSVQYNVANHLQCGQRNPASGTHSRIGTNPELQWKLVAANTYIATVYPDLMMDEDYYGNGVCRWQFTEARARLKATGAVEETRFVPGFLAADILAAKTVTLYFWGGRYPADTPPPSDGKGFPYFGDSNLDRVPLEQRNEFFTITLTAKEVQP